MGRLVQNHSTNLVGLLQILQKLAKCKDIKTITPGAINRAKGSSQRLKIRVTSAIMGGYKLIARKGSTVQEIFIITCLNIDELRVKIDEIIN